MTWKILRVFVTTLTDDDKYSHHSRHNLMQPNQMHLSQKQKTFSQFFYAFFKSTLNFRHSQKKITLIAYVFPKKRTPKDMVRKMPKKSSFRVPLERQHGKRDETLIQSLGQDLCYIHGSL